MEPEMSTLSSVSYLDLSWSIKDGEVKKFKEDEKIKPGTFRVLKEGEWAPGMQVAYEEDGQKKAGYIISLTDEITGCWQLQVCS